MSRVSVLIVEDDLDLAALLASHLRDEGFFVRLAHTGKDAVVRLNEGPFSLAIVDRNLPDVDGIRICEEIRTAKRGTGLILLTCLSQTSQRIAGLNAGADDYITKPFSVQELIARVHSVLRRSLASPMQPSSPLITRGDLQINKETRAVHLHGNDLGLTETEYDLLVFLAENPGRKFSRTELLHNVWGYTLSGYEHTVNTRINRLRTKLGDDSTNPKYILTVWGFGYQFTDAFEGESSE